MILYSSISILAENLKIQCTKRVIFHLILLGVPSSLVLPVKNKRWFTARCGLLTSKTCYVWQKLFGDPLRKRLLRHYLKSKTNKNFKVLLGQIIYKHHKQLVFFCCLCCFLIQQWPCHNNMVTERGFNLFDDCASECVGRRVYLFFLGDTVKCTLLAPYQIHKHRECQLK